MKSKAILEKVIRDKLEYMIVVRLIFIPDEEKIHSFETYPSCDAFTMHSKVIKHLLVIDL